MLNELTAEERRELNFFYGGCGDCRHVYMTLYDLGRQMEQGGEEVRTGNRVHFLLNDSHPAIFARTLLLLDALHDLSAKPIDAIRAIQEPSVVEVFVFLYYVFLSPVVPLYLQEQLKSRIERLLRDRGTSYSSLYVTNSNWAGVEKVLKEWLATLRGSDGGNQMNLRQEVENFLEIYKPPNATGRLKNQTVKWLRDYVEEMGLDKELDMDDRALLIRDRQLQKLGRMVADMRESVFVDMNLEADLVYMIIHRMLPPPNQDLAKHSPSVQTYRELSLNRDDVQEAKQLLIKGVACQITRLIHSGYMKTALMKDYTANVTIIDPMVDDPRNNNPDIPANHYQRAAHFSTLEFLAKLYIGDGIEPPHGDNLTLFDLSCNLWEKAAFAVKTLRQDADSRLCFEHSIGDMNCVAREVVLKEKERKEMNLPTRFLRAFTSNVPDYTGLLYPMVDIGPLLLPSTKAFLRLNALYNMSYWVTPENFTKSMLVLNDAEQAKNVYGVHLLPGSRLRNFVYFGKYRHAVENPGSLTQEEVRMLIRRVCIGVALPPCQKSCGSRSQKRSGAVFVLYTETLVVVMELLRFLLDRGVNSSWVARTVEEILETKNLVCNPRPSTNERFSDDKAVCFEPFLLELRTLLSFYQPVLNLDLRPDYPLPPFNRVSVRSVTWKDSERAIGPWEMAGLILLPDKYRKLHPRDMALNPPGDLPQAHFISAFRWEISKMTAWFYLPDKDYFWIKYCGWCAMLYNTATWEPLTDPMVVT